MDKFSFIASIVRSLAWPILIIALILIFRVQVAHLLTRLIRINIKGNTLEFNESTSKAEVIVQGITGPTGPKEIQSQLQVSAKLTSDARVNKVLGAEVTTPNTPNSTSDNSSNYEGSMFNMFPTNKSLVYGAWISLTDSIKKFAKLSGELEFIDDVDELKLVNALHKKGFIHNELSRLVGILQYSMKLLEEDDKTEITNTACRNFVESASFAKRAFEQGGRLPVGPK